MSHRYGALERLLTASLILLMLVSSCGKTEKPNIVLIIIDTLNADHLGCYNYYRNTSPVIDSLASSGTMWARMQAQAPWTLPGMVSIYTGLTERTHGCNDYDGYSHGLDPELPTIVTMLNDLGYNTAGFVNINYLGSVFGMDIGFEYFLLDDEGHGRAAETVDQFISWLDGDEFSEPFFVVFHLFDAHAPYDPPGGFATAFSEFGTMGVTNWQPNEDGSVPPGHAEHMCALYDAEILWIDSQLSRMFQGIRQRLLSENTLIVFTADHGEEFMEHGQWGHSQNLYQQSLHIPLIMSGPGIPENRVDSTVAGQFDILPTVLAYLGEDIPGRIEGINVLGSDMTEIRDIPSSGVRSDSSQVTILNGNKKVIWSPVGDCSEMFDIVADPFETDYLDVDSILLSRVLEYWAWPRLWEPTSTQLGIIEKKKLESLGYIR